MAWSLVQHPRTALASGTSGSGTITATAGNLLLAIFLVNPNATAVQVPTQTGNATWVQLGQQTNTATTGTTAIFGAIAQAGESTTVSTTWTTAASGDLVLAEFSGITGSLVQDGAAAVDNHTATGSTTIATPSYTPGVTGDLVVNAATVQTDTVGITPGTPWTAGDNATVLGNTGGYWCWTTGALSAIAANMTQTSAGAYIGVTVGVEAGAGGGGGGGGGGGPPLSYGNYFYQQNR